MADSKRWLEGSGALCLIIDPSVSWPRQKCYWGFHITGYLQDKLGYVLLTLLLTPCVSMFVCSFAVFNLRIGGEACRVKLFSAHWKRWWLSLISLTQSRVERVRVCKRAFVCVCLWASWPSRSSPAYMYLWKLTEDLESWTHYMLYNIFQPFSVTTYTIY